ncbi:hypothetical protein M798_07775 [Brucella melitensis ADMAS-G1]|nr:hypothetical protein M798_07775 [Brucella melitensis ADMAS-G1]
MRIFIFASMREDGHMNRKILLSHGETFRFSPYAAISGRQKAELPWLAINTCGPAFAETNHKVLQSKGFKAQTSKVTPDVCSSHKSRKLIWSQSRNFKKSININSLEIF